MIVLSYYIRPPQRGVAAYFNDLVKRTEKPLLMYHIPGRTAFIASLETLGEIVEATPDFVGMKHASLDLALLSDALAEFGPEFRVFVGLEDVSFPMLCIGASGMMNAGGNLAPAKVAALYEAVATGDLAVDWQLHFEPWELNKAIFFDTNPIPVKYMMKRLGIIPANEHRLPMMSADKTLEERLNGVLSRAGMLERSAAE